MVVGMHRQGHAVALGVLGLEVGGGETQYVFCPVDPKEEFLLFMSDTLEVTAASHETMTMLGVRSGGACRWSGLGLFLRDATLAFCTVHGAFCGSSWRANFDSAACEAAFGGCRCTAAQ